jgi:hypothetical protein
MHFGGSYPCSNPECHVSIFGVGQDEFAAVNIRSQARQLVVQGLLNHVGLPQVWRFGPNPTHPIIRIRHLLPAMRSRSLNSDATVICVQSDRA